MGQIIIVIKIAHKIIGMLIIKQVEIIKQIRQLIIQQIVQ
jgi:hypothetical protein